jgi:hypothetical protein
MTIENKENTMKRFTLREQQAQAAEIASRSNYLWRSVNNYIAHALLNKGKRGREYIARSLEKLAGPPLKSEPCSVGNFRTAAKQIRAGERLFVL